MAEEKNQLHIEVRDKIATLTSHNFQLVGGNSDYEVVFDFDEDWDNYPVKTALFVYGKETKKKVFDGSVCEGVAIEGATICLIGVYAGDIATTTPACISGIRQSIRDVASDFPEAPDEDVYNQIMELLNRYINAVKGAPSGGTKGQVLKKNSAEDYDYSWQDDLMRDLTDYYTKEESDNRFATPDIVDTKIKEYLEENPPENGISPTIVVSKIENGHRVTITDAKGVHSFDVMNGEQGVQGEKGNDGYTPKREVDYWTPDDVSAIHSYIDGQITPLREEINGVEETLVEINDGGIV